MILGTDLSRGQGGSSTTTYSWPFSYPESATDIVTGDFNGDGNLDVAVPAGFANGADLALFLGTDGGALNKTPQFYQAPWARQSPSVSMRSGSRTSRARPRSASHVSSTPAADNNLALDPETVA